MKDIDEIRRENMRALEAEAGGPTEAAKRVGMSPAQWANLRDGAKDSATGRPRGMRKETARRIAAGFGKPVGWLDINHATQLSVREPASPYGSPVDSDLRDDLVGVRKVSFRVSAGIAGYSIEYLDNGDGTPLFFSRAWVQRRGFDPAKLYAMKVGGKSMEPTFFESDVVVVNTGDTQREDGAVFVFNYEGEPVIKRLVRDMRQWWLVSDSSDQTRYPRKVCDEGTFLIGRVVYRQTEQF